MKQQSLSVVVVRRTFNNEVVIQHRSVDFVAFVDITFKNVETIATYCVPLQ